MFTYQSLKSSTRVLVYENYEIISFDNIDQINEDTQQLWRFFKGERPSKFHFTPIYTFISNFKKSIYFPDVKNGPVQFVIPTEQSMQKALNEEKPSSYDLLQMPNLHTHLSRVDDATTLLAFCRKYGIPSGLSPTPLNPFAGLMASNDDVLIHMQSMTSIINESKHLSDLLHLWKAVKEKDEKHIQTNWHIYKQLYRSSKTKSTNYFDKAVIVLNELLKDENGKLVIKRESGDIRSYVSFDDVLSYANFLLKRSIVNNDTFTFRECKKCGLLFETDHMSRRYCPPLPYSGRSSCENANNQKRRRNRQKEAKTDG